VEELHTRAIWSRIEVFAEVSRRKERLETASAIAKISVYVLFLFGWTLGLAFAGTAVA
jgi:hypothetical protein